MIATAGLGVLWSSIQTWLFPMHKFSLPAITATAPFLEVLQGARNL